MCLGLTNLRPIRFTKESAMPNTTDSPNQAVAVHSPLGLMYTKPLLLSKLPHLLLIFALSILASSSIWAQVGWNKAYENGLVVSAEGAASEVGRHILQQGGNAVDAAIAVQFALAVTLPRAGNLGGGGFMVAHMADGTVASTDFRERAPGLAHRDMYLDSGGITSPTLANRRPCGGRAWNGRWHGKSACALRVYPGQICSPRHHASAKATPSPTPKPLH